VGIVGAITHTTGYAAALVASATHYQGIGIDCEVVLSTDNLKLQRHICVPNELEELQVAHHTWPPELLLTLVFSAKESLYKCLYPQVQKYFGFCAARVVALDSERHTFVIQLDRNTLRAATHTLDKSFLSAILAPRISAIMRGPVGGHRDLPLTSWSTLCGL
jgi:4'-phosphopantetheinyl transferase EntD